MQHPWLPLLANIAPWELWRKPASHMFLDKVLTHPEWAVHNGHTVNHPPQQLVSQRPLWSNTLQFNLQTWCTVSLLGVSYSGQSAVVNHLVSMFLIGYGVHWLASAPAKASVLQDYNKWGLASSNNCRCRRRMVPTISTPPPQPLYGPFPGTIRVRRCQKGTSGLYGARGD